jgi:cytochrome c553
MKRTKLRRRDEPLPISIAAMRSSIALAVLLSCVACKAEERPADRGAQQDSPKPEQAKQPQQPEQPKPELSKTMSDHFARATALEQAVIDGDLEFVRTHAQWLVDELPAATLPEPWQPQLARMQAAAGEAAKAENLTAAASATGKVIETCGACHAALGVGPKFGPATPVPEGETSQARMQRHQWAAERMREGMIGPSDERWQLGAGAVSVAPPQPCPIESAEILPDDVLQLREKIYEIGAQAAVTKSSEERARVYGEYLSTCAGCHIGGC